MDSGFSSSQSISDDLSGDETDLSALLPRRAWPWVSTSGEDTLSEDERATNRAATRKRKASAPAWQSHSTAKRPRTGNSTSASTRSAGRQRSQLRFSPEETERWVEIVSECKSEGLLRPDSRRVGPVWDSLVTAFAREFPDKKWTRETMETKLAAEKRRCDQFLAALTALCPSHDEGTDVVEDTEQDSSMIVKHYPDALRPQSKPLGDRDLHDDIFSQETFITGQDIDAITPREYSEEEDVTTDEEDWPGDQDLTIGNGSASAIRHALPDTSIHRPARRQPMDNTIVTLANTNQLAKHPGFDAVASASKDLQARYAGKDGQPGQYSKEVVSYCLHKFRRTPVFAAVWCGLSEHSRDIRMARFAREYAELEQLL